MGGVGNDAGTAADARAGPGTSGDARDNGDNTLVLGCDCAPREGEAREGSDGDDLLFLACDGDGEADAEREAEGEGEVVVD
jgi:hypothetical protein